jgi:sulfite reductase (ferredoxin)
MAQASMAALVAVLALAPAAEGFVSGSSASLRASLPTAARRHLSATTTTMIAEPPVKPVKLDKINLLKLNSQALREPVRSEMAKEEIFINHDAYQILKFHGSYMQDNRDNRAKGAEKDYSFMLRLKMPAGECTPELYRLLDDLSNEYGHGHLRLTTRQTFQLHGVAKHDLKHVIKSIMDVGSSTVGGCGDVNRNIMTTPAPITHKPEYVYARQYTKVSGSCSIVIARTSVYITLQHAII